MKENVKTVIIAENLAIALVRKKVKKLRLSVHAPKGEVRLSVPWHTPEDFAIKFALSKLDWILKHRQRFIARSETQTPSLGNNSEHCWIWGILYKLQTEEGDFRPQLAINETERTVTMRISPQMTVAKRQELLNDFYKTEIKREIPILLAQWEATMGVNSSAWRVQVMKSRWGSCQPQTKRICLNVRLAEKSLRCLEYVIVHELAHLFEANHSKRFYAVMDRFLPDWRERKRELNGGILDTTEKM
jgi:predicted metal-dependent hydrolase